MVFLSNSTHESKGLIAERYGSAIYIINESDINAVIEYINVQNFLLNSISWKIILHIKDWY